MTTRLFDNPTTERRHAAGIGVQRKYEFDNGYAASVVRFTMGAGLGGSYGAEDGKWELAVLDSEGHIVYDTPVTDDVLGWLSEDDAEEALQAIAALPVRVSA